MLRIFNDFFGYDASHHDDAADQIFNTHFISHFNEDNYGEISNHHYDDLVKYFNFNAARPWFNKEFNQEAYNKRIKELANDDEKLKYVISIDQFMRLCDAAVNGNFQETVNTITDEIYKVKNTLLNKEQNTSANDSNKTTDSDKNDENTNVFNNLKGGRNTNKKKAFKLFAGIRKTTEDQPKEESSEATVAYQPSVANNFYGNTGVTNQITFSPATDFRTVEEKINELYARLVMETDRNKILYIAQQIINLVPNKESFMKTLLSKLKG